MYIGREILLYYVENMMKYCGGVKIYLKCEDLNYIGVYKINNIIG